jgi:hypothetical protein
MSLAPISSLLSLMDNNEDVVAAKHEPTRKSLAMLARRDRWKILSKTVIFSLK